MFGRVYSRPKERYAMTDDSNRVDPRDQTRARALYKDGFALFAKGQVDLAIVRYREAIDVDARLAIAWNGLALALAKQGDLDAAIDAAEKLVELEPDDALSHTNLSRILMQKGLIPEAEDAKARAMSLQMKARG
jgi:tetratricopeptide (TPR) repeat protein